MQTILLTGFANYSKGDKTIVNNPSEFAVKTFEAQYPVFYNYKVVCSVLDGTNHDIASAQMTTLLHTHQPIIHLGLGMKSSGTAILLLENQATLAANTLETTLNTDLIKQNLDEFNILSAISSNAGLGSCNAVYYTALAYYETAKGQTLFIHTPCIDTTLVNNKKPNIPPISIEDLIKTIEISFYTMLFNQNYEN